MTPSAGRVRFPRRAVTFRTASVTGLAITALLVTGCNSPSATSSGQIRVVGAENEYANVVAQIGGRYVNVAAVMNNPNTDPHTFEASTSVAEEVSSAQLVVQNGVNYDTFMNQLESASPNSHRRVIDVQTLLGYSSLTKNPHLWYNPATMPAVAKAVERDLASLAPAHAHYFARRLQSFQNTMATVTSAIATFRSHFAGTAVATTEPVADYLLGALGLHNETPFRFQADIMHGVDPSPEDIASQQRLFTSHGVKLFCYNAQVSSTVTVDLRSLAQSSRVPVVAVYETMPTPGYDYQTWMLAEIAAMTKALTSHVSTKELS